MVKIIPVQVLRIQAVIHFVVAKANACGGDASHYRGNGNERDGLVFMIQQPLIKSENKIDPVIPEENNRYHQQLLQVKIRFQVFLRKV